MLTAKDRMVDASTTYRCGSCRQLLPFDAATRVPEACLARCQGRCDWSRVGPTDDGVRRRAALPGAVGPDGLPPDPPPALPARSAEPA